MYVWRVLKCAYDTEMELERLNDKERQCYQLHKKGAMYDTHTHIHTYTPGPYAGFLKGWFFIIIQVSARRVTHGPCACCLVTGVFLSIHQDVDECSDFGSIVEGKKEDVVDLNAGYIQHCILDQGFDQIHQYDLYSLCAYYVCAFNFTRRLKSYCM